jgi:hypothetical protein
MRLVVHELVTELSQTLKPSKHTNVCAIRPHLYIHNAPSGSLKVQIKTSDGVLISESEELVITEITDAVYFHGYVRFDIKAFLMRDIEYQVCVVGADGYSFSESAYCGVCNDYDLKKYEAEYEQSAGLSAPLDIEVWALSSK